MGKWIERWGLYWGAEREGAYFQMEICISKIIRFLFRWDSMTSIFQCTQECHLQRNKCCIASYQNKFTSNMPLLQTLNM